jgi:outer membrane immunogenic protein
MKRCINLCAVTLLAAGLSTTAFAADLAVKAPPPAPIPFTWTGCYVGGHVGGVVSEDRTTNLLGSSVSFSSAGFVGGGQVGCDYQFATNWVVGAEGRAAWSSLRNSHAGTVRNLVTGVVVPSQVTMRNDFLASATARLGYAFADRWLVFVRGGGAWTREKLDDAFTTPAGVAVNPSGTSTRTGWTAGTGVDWAFAQNWSAVFEYDYYDFGNHSALLANGTGTTVNIFSLKDHIHAATAGVNYHF